MDFPKIAALQADCVGEFQAQRKKKIIAVMVVLKWWRMQTVSCIYMQMVAVMVVLK